MALYSNISLKTAALSYTGHTILKTTRMWYHKGTLNKKNSKWWTSKIWDCGGFRELVWVYNV